MYITWKQSNGEFVSVASATVLEVQQTGQASSRLVFADTAKIVTLPRSVVVDGLCRSIATKLEVML